MYLIYNLLTAKSKTTGEAYIETLGYSVNASGEVDYAALINETMDGPIIVASNAWYNALPFPVSGSAFYRNGVKCILGDVAMYDVVYYSQSTKTVWAYNNKVSGTYEGASPNTSSPASVTVSGKEYPVSSSSAAYALSSLGTFSVGDSVTLLLGKDGSVAGVAPSGEVNTDIYGMVLSVATKAYQDANGKSYEAQVLTVVDTAGVSHEYPSDKSFSAGALVKVTFSAGKTDISSLSRSSLNGLVSASRGMIGKYPVASGAEILDISEDQYKRIYPSRLDGYTLAPGDVAFYTLNEKGELSRLILNNVTNDANSFALVSSIRESENSRQYTYYINGTQSTLSATVGMYNINSGGCMLIKSGNSIEQIKNLSKIDLDSVNESYATSKHLTFTLSSDVQVYVKNDTDYYLSSVSIVSDTDAYSLTAYYDKPQSECGRVRIIVASPR